MTRKKLRELGIDGTKIKASVSNFSVLSKEELDEVDYSVINCCSQGKQQIKGAIDTELKNGIEIDVIKDDIYGNTDPNKIPELFKEKIRGKKMKKTVDRYKKVIRKRRSELKT